DYYTANNTGMREYNLVPPSPTPDNGGGGSTDPLALLVLFALASPRLVRRHPHAPHHSLRLRQLLRIG
ncbi:MAG: hypothetical protein Q7V62_07675, partial [Actinomycetota bacterium]|nr:hypothetical protein [Actinomycetota bacterium]